MHLTETLYARMKFPGNLKKKKFRKVSTLIKSFLSDCGNCAATRISLYHLKHTSLEFFMAEKGEYGSIVFSSITDQ